MRVLISGMGGHLGTRVASLLEQDAAITELVGVDVDPPRRRLRRARFHRIHPADRARLAMLVRSVDPNVVVHLGVYEPHARAAPRSAISRTAAGAVTVLGAAAESPSLEAMIIRSGIEIYGRRRGVPACPDEQAPIFPTTAFGQVLADLEHTAEHAAHVRGVSLGVIRCAPVVGPHIPSPLGRLLRLPVVPVSATDQPTFSLLHQDDAAAAIVAAVHQRFHGTVNVAGAGAVTPWQAVRLGGRIPLPVIGLQWNLAEMFASAAGAPIPDHVIELLRRGRTADATRCGELLGVQPHHSTEDVVKALYEWASVTVLSAARVA